jgi:hypothetical protein
MAEVAATKKKMGRPPKAPEKGKRQNYTFRMSEADREKVAAAAEAAGRSFSEELEARVGRSFTIEEEFGSGSRLDMLRLLAVTLRMTERLTGETDYEKIHALIEARAAIDTTLGHFIGAAERAKTGRDRLVEALTPSHADGSTARALANVLASSAGIAPTLDPEDLITLARAQFRDDPEGLRQFMIDAVNAPYPDPSI